MAGVRYVDIRLGKVVDPTGVTPYDLYCVHGSVNLLQTFRLNVLPACYTFPTDNPLETIVMSVKTDDTDVGSVSNLIGQVSSERPDLWYAGGGFPTLGEARGKIVVLNRWGGSFGTQGPIPDNPTGTYVRDPSYPAGTRLYVQDNYSFSQPVFRSALDAKWHAVDTAVTVATATPLAEPTWVLSYTSAAQNSLDQILAGFNPNSFAHGSAVFAPGVPGINDRLADRLDGSWACRSPSPRTRRSGSGRARSPRGRRPGPGGWCCGPSGRGRRRATPIGSG